MAKAPKQAVAPGLESALEDIQKMFGVGSIMKMGENLDIKVDAVSTGIRPLDMALGVGGLPLGRMVEIYGPESSGKSTIALHVVAEAQKQGMTCAYIDSEYAMDPLYAAALGVDVDKVYISQPDYGEQGLQIVDRLASSGAVPVIVVDSVATLTPRAEIEGDYGDSHVGLQARMMSQALRKLTGVCATNGVLVVWVNQIREKIGVIYGSPEVTPGGRALKFYSSVRLDVRRIETLKDGTGDATANRTRVKVVKNKVSPPYTQCEFDIEFGRGAAKEGILLDLAVEYGAIKKSGAWYATIGGEQIGQGKEKSKQALRENPALFKEIDAELDAILESL
jgi:recombination protein RecA